MTTKIGMMQHSRFSRPLKKYGYSIDDNARALIVAVWFFKLYRKKIFLKSANVYLNFLEKMQLQNGRFHNFYSWDKKFIDDFGSDDSFGRTIWALGFLYNFAPNQTMKQKAKKLFEKALPVFDQIVTPRSIAFLILGLYFFSKAGLKKYNKEISILADKLLNFYQENHSKDWLWFENMMTYSNAILPWSLFLASKATKNKKYLTISKKTLNFLDKVCYYKGKPCPIGQNGWYHKGGKKALFDQQVVDVCDMVIIFSEYHCDFGDIKYLQKAQEWFSWFWGNNIRNTRMINLQNGGCYDGLRSKILNNNQGAESTVCYLLAWLYLRKAQSKK
jgi:hypothetical protein